MLYILFELFNFIDVISGVLHSVLDYFDSETNNFFDKKLFDVIAILIDFIEILSSNDVVVKACV